MKRTMSLLLTAIMLLCLVPLNALTAIATNTAIIKVENVSAIPNSTVDVAISITDNPGIASIGLTLSFDEALTLIGASNGEAFSDLTMTPPAQLKKNGSVSGSCRFAWLGNENATDDGIILNLKFKVSENAELNKGCVISLVCESGDVLDEARNTVNVTTENGKITVIDYTPGDVDGTGTINMMDVLTLCQYYVDGCQYDPDGYAINLNPECGDVDANGKVNMMDVLMICQYYVDGCKYDSDGYAVKLLPGKVPCDHILEKTEEVAPTCTDDGNIAYWHCTKCGEYYSDANASNVISLESTVVKAKGHSIVTDPAVPATYESTGLTEGSHCSECNEVVIKQEVTPILQKDWYSITYHELKGASYPSVTQYSKQDGLSELESILATGYTFDGWYDKNGNKFVSIPLGTSGNIDLYAHWTAIAYRIKYDCSYYEVTGTNSSENPTIYTIEDSIEFEDASLTGYNFIGWELNGQIITSIPKGTSGNLSLKAKWAAKKNIVHNNEDFSVPYEVIEEENENQTSFVYYMGYIDNVILDSVSDNQNFIYYGGNGTISEKLSTSKLTGTNVAESVSDTTTKTNGWQESIGGSSESEFNIGAIKETITFEVSRIENRSTVTSHNDGTVTTTLNQTTESNTKEISLSPKDSRGWYRYVNYGTIDVYAVITYDAVKNEFYTGNINVVTVNGQNWAYSAKSSKFDDETYGELTMDIDTVLVYLEQKRIELRTPLAEKYNMTVGELDEYVIYGIFNDIPIDFPQKSIVDMSLDTDFVSYLRHDDKSCNIVGDSTIYLYSNTKIRYPISFNLKNESSNYHFILCHFGISGDYALMDNSAHNVTFDLLGDCDIASAISLENSNVSINYSGTENYIRDYNSEAIKSKNLQITSYDSDSEISIIGGGGSTCTDEEEHGTEGNHGIVANDVSITTTGKITIYGGYGATHQFCKNGVGGNGGNGGTGIVAHQIILNVTGEISIIGGAGGTACERDLSGGNGGNGGMSIECDGLSIQSENGKYEFTSGNGGRGGDGFSFDRNNNAFGYASDGRNGGNGGNGGSSGDFMEVESFLYLSEQQFNSNTISLKSGNGGRGGNGGHGEFAGFDKNPTAQAGKGGNGGKGGDSTSLILSEFETFMKITVYCGNGGNGGNGGDGGNSDEEWHIWPIGRTKWSNPGNGGTGGSGGISQNNIDISTCPNVAVIAGTNGSNGNNGSNGIADSK